MLMGSLSLQTIVNTWQCFLKACTKGYVVNSCLVPPLNTDNEAVSHSATAALTSYEHLGVWLCSFNRQFMDSFLTLSIICFLPCLLLTCIAQVTTQCYKWLLCSHHSQQTEEYLSYCHWLESPPAPVVHHCLVPLSQLSEVEGRRW